ncbi:MAG: XkdX family protein [Oscillospiraceae bacterium]
MIKTYYDKKLWTIDRVWATVGKQLGITEVEYEKITGFIYPNKC